MPWLTDNWFKLSLLILIAMLGFLYIETISTKDNNTTSTVNPELIKLKHECYQAGAETHKNDSIAIDEETRQLEGNYRFIQDTGECYYKGGFVSPTTIQHYIKNVYTNETLAEYIVTISSDPAQQSEVIYGDEEYYNQVKERLFGIDFD